MRRRKEEIQDYTWKLLLLKEGSLRLRKKLSLQNLGPKLSLKTTDVTPIKEISSKIHFDFNFFDWQWLSQSTLESYEIRSSTNLNKIILSDFEV